jgi:diguanylate cyclase (GGDEF)-like protein
LTAQLRASDIVARIGGDEFAILLTRADPTIGITRATDLQIELNRSTVYFDNMEVPLSVSMGTQTYGAGDTVNGILRKADLAMYRDKRLRQCEKAPTH